MSIATDFGPVRIGIAEPLIKFVRSQGPRRCRRRCLAEGNRCTLGSLTGVANDARAKGGANETTLRIEMHVPRDFDRR